MFGFGYFFIHKMRQDRAKRREEIQKLNNLHKKVKVVKEQIANSMLPTITSMNPMNNDSAVSLQGPVAVPPAARRKTLVRRHSFAATDTGNQLRGSRRTQTFPHSDDPNVLEKYRPLTSQKPHVVLEIPKNTKKAAVVSQLPNQTTASPTQNSTAAPTAPTEQPMEHIEPIVTIPTVAQRRSALMKQFSSKEFKPMLIRQPSDIKHPKISDLLRENKV